MENKINIAELLKDCPKGMELDCALFDNVILSRIDLDSDCDYPIRIETKGGCLMDLTKYGTYTNEEEAKCLIFPKGKNTWKGFHRPFKDGDIVYVCDEYSDATFTYVAILKQIEKRGKIHSHCFYNFEDKYFSTHDFLYDGHNTRFATEEEKQKLFDAIKANGYKWNAETNTLEKLIEPIFKVGDRIRPKSGYSPTGAIIGIDANFYQLENLTYVLIVGQDKWELVPNKFNINTLKPFDKVLVRDNDKQEWVISFFSHCNGLEIYKYSCINGGGYEQCIPYEKNEHLLGTTKDCDDYYKTWEK